MQNFKYLVANEKDELWGLTVSTIGYEEVKPLDDWPSHGHADGYYFRPERGRTLNEYQVLYVCEGEGFFESAHVKRTHLHTGDIFLLFPGEWHTYRPLTTVGWHNYWIGFKGENMDARVKAGFLSAQKPIYHIGFSDDVIRLYKDAADIAFNEPAYAQQILAGIVNHLIGMIYSLERNIILNKDKMHVDIVARARAIIRDNLEEDITIQGIAEQMGQSYSSFRKLFKEFAGVSPAHYQQELRLQRAKELLSSTAMSIKEVAYKLHFESADYFSSKFRKKVGMTPSDFRNSLA